MRSPRPTLQKKLLAWLLGPLLGLLIVDTLVPWSTSSGFSNQAYDRSLEEMAREVSLHVRLGAARPGFEMPADAERILRVDQDDRVYFKVSAGDGAVIGGDHDLAPPPSPVRPGKPLFYDGML